MYEAFFSLEDAPFVLTPDPRFLLRSKGHHEVLSTLIYGITSQKGLMALIGDVGTGKTVLCRALLRELPKDVKSALVLNPYLSDAELLGTILDDLGVERQGSTKGELMTVLSQYLLTAGGEGKTVVVILDEAQQMSVEALEQIRILSTLETATRKLLQIVLVGQPELEEKLAAARAAPARPAHRHPLLPQAPVQEGDLPLHRAPTAHCRPARSAAVRARGLVADLRSQPRHPSRDQPGVRPLADGGVQRARPGGRPRRWSRRRSGIWKGSAPGGASAARTRALVAVGALGRVAAVVAGVVLLGSRGCGRLPQRLEPGHAPVPSQGPGLAAPAAQQARSTRLTARGRRRRRPQRRRRPRAERAGRGEPAAMRS